MKKHNNFKLRAIAAVAAALIMLLSVTASAVTTVMGKDGIASQKPVGKTFYLPPYADLSALEVNAVAEKYGYSADSLTEFPKDCKIDITPGKITDKFKNDCYRVYFSSGETTFYHTFYLCSDIPSVFVATSQGASYINQSKNNRDKESQIIIIDKDGNAVYDDFIADTYSEIKGRGNASFGYAKKPYQIKLASKTDLFGLGKAKTWILLANYIDSSFIRNAVAFEIADVLEMPYTSGSEFVNLYIDNVFCGLYQLCEKVQIGKNRIEITDLEEQNEKITGETDLDSLPVVTVTSGELIIDSIITNYSYVSGMSEPEDITGGYLVELDNLYSRAEKCKFTTQNGNTYVIKSPECASRAEVEYIAKIFADFEEALYSKTGYNYSDKHYSEYCDIDSLARVYAVEEITKNWDAYIGSTFFYKEAGADTKLYAGPVWDFDNTWGNLFRGTFGTEPTEIWADGNSDYGGSKYQCDFGGALTSHDDAMALVRKYYNSASETVAEMLAESGYIDKLTAKIYDSVSADKARWGTERNAAFKQFQVYDSESTQSAIGNLRDFMEKRIAALDVTLGGKTPGTPEETTTEKETTVTTTTTKLAETTVTTETSTATEETAPVSSSSEQTESTKQTEKPTFSPRAADIIPLVAICAVAIIIIVVLIRRKK